MTWESWSAGDTRCPICEGLEPSDFEACCDCSRWSVEQGYGQPAIGVIGSHIYVPISPTPSEQALEQFRATPPLP